MKQELTIRLLSLAGALALMALLQGCGQSGSESRMPFLPATNRVERYLLGDTNDVISKKLGDSILSLVSDYDSFSFSIWDANHPIGEAEKGFVQIAFSS